MSLVKSSREGPSRLNGTTQGTSEEGHTPKLRSKLHQAAKLIRPGTKGAQGRGTCSSVATGAGTISPEEPQDEGDTQGHSRYTPSSL